MADSDMREEESGGVGFGAICRVIFQWKRLLAILLSTVVAALCAFLVVKFIVNPGKIQYEADFDFHIAGNSSSSALYASGQFFAEEETLTAVKNSDERFRDVKIEEMLPGGSNPIKVSLETEKVDEDIYKSYYSITVKGNLFPSEKTAQDFLKAVINYAKDKAVADTKMLAEKDSAGLNGYETQLKAYANVLTYEEKLSALLAQRDYLLGFYDGWIGAYGGMYFVQSKGMTLMELREAVQSAFTDTQYSELSTELSANAYQKSYNDASLDTKRATYVEQQKLNEARLESLKEELDSLIEKYKNTDGSASSIMPQFGEFHSRIIVLTEENVMLQKQIDAIDKMNEKNTKYDAAYVAQERKFGESLQKVYTALAQQSEQITAVAEEIVERESYTTVLKIQDDGGISTLLVTAAMAIVVFVLAAAVCYVIAVRRDRNAKSAEGAAEKTAEQQELPRGELPTDNTPNE